MPPTGRSTGLEPSRMERPSGVTYVGVDPGAGGGLASISPLASLRKVSASGVKMPDTERDVWEWFRSGRSSVEFAVIEKVSGFIGKPQPGSAMFKFGQSYGFLRACLIAACIPFEEATPQKWQKALGVTPRGKDEEKGKFKNRLKSMAQQIFPDVVVTLANADALLIAEYCKRLREGKL